MFNLDRVISFCITSSVFFQFIPVYGDGCRRRDTSNGFVCVCDGNFCDTLPDIKLQDGIVQVFETSKSGNMFQADILKFEDEAEGDQNGLEISIQPMKRYQSIMGFGGAFTDSTGIAISSLSENAQRLLIRSYFSKDGSEYNMGRVPISSTDFSDHVYSYDETEGDFELRDFALTKEDFQYKIPYIKEAQQVAFFSGINLKLFASSWSAPYWMKTNNNMSGFGSLKSGENYHTSYANYLVKFFEEYQKDGIKFWGMTVQNEPLDGLIPFFPFQAMGFTARGERDFLGDYLGPTLKRSGLDYLKIMISDDQRALLYSRVNTIMQSATASPFVSGVAFHWYYNWLAPAFELDRIHGSYPDLFIMPSEACTGDKSDTPVLLGSWDRGERYGSDIIEDLNHWANGWTDWNLVLDSTGGPNWANNNVDSPIIVNAREGEFYKQPMYYVLAHFSKLLPRDSVRVGVDVKTFIVSPVEVTAFQRPDNAFVVHILNRNSRAVDIRLLSNIGTKINRQVPANSLQSYIWRN